MFYFMTDITHFLFTVILLWTYVVKDFSDSERGNLLPSQHRLLFPISSKESFIHTRTFVTFYLR